jgi:pSer/pThr/pTyr-binding forkhead associated (FHA) protein
MGGGYDYGGKPESGTTVLGGGAGDTTVLGGDSNSTTVLSGGANYGSLTRTKNGERVTISKDQFKIGRERSRVDFCISDNTAVGRLHAIIVSRGGSTYVVDQNSTNCTFVNNVRATANQEVRLNNGDKVTFADEEFTYNAF